jgi:hydroxymethylpyrimidine pyrophosphatase-like HAD family hydrolase
VREQFAAKVHARQTTPQRENLVTAARSQPYYLDVTHPEANKGYVVTCLSKLLGIPVAEIATIGDMPNDISMFEKSGISIAMGQASEEVKSAATYTTSSSEEEGFAKAVEEFVLNHGQNTRSTP